MSTFDKIWGVMDPNPVLIWTRGKSKGTPGRFSSNHVRPLLQDVSWAEKQALKHLLVRNEVVAEGMGVDNGLCLTRRRDGSEGHCQFRSI